MLNEGEYVRWVERVEDFMATCGIDGIAAVMKDVTKMEEPTTRENLDDLVTGVDFMEGGKAIMPVLKRWIERRESTGK